jgi:hypothetical protein
MTRDRSKTGSPPTDGEAAVSLHEGEAAVALHIGVVHGADGVRHVCAASTRAALDAQLAAYAERSIADRADAAARAVLRTMLDAGAVGEALAFYFRLLRQRWDEERLDVRLVEVDAPPLTTARA